MTTIRQLLQHKGGAVWSIPPDATVLDAIGKMAERNVGSMLVLDGERLVGIITERDYARSVVLKGKASSATRVSEIMERRVVCVRPDHSVEQCMALMSDKRVRHLPVIEEKKVVGIVSIGDLVKSIIGEQQFLIEQLEHYIHHH